ncbi:mannose-1-phosphate guanylyltransferase/mannose-6-phosphate isomerase [Hydrogenimonas urashimensis]|uniref:mannose-1-phosphate guanylyltransferase/mannose-6-phosphate isomerase n=1 Tax=Hydrogenimonas urashimensis TaxID=2740515 RepID=UPI001915534A|nr:mannose-1-phosphate guanylyltransferase/mannose-6-phosphate isomerase [Hydrogenimonas urashimensis]
MTNIILCGGNGTRLWPISRKLMPKQFIKLFDGQSLFQMTVKRNSAFCRSQFIVSNEDQYFLAIDQIEEINDGRAYNIRHTAFLLEPVGRNTAPAIALACFAIDAEQVVLVTPSDHLIKDQAAYEKVIKRAAKLAEAGHMVTFGIQPDSPNTGYGYIEANGEDVVAFHEKPDAQTARSYLESGRFFWNSGMFCFKAGVYLEELQTHAPEIFEASKKAYERAKLNGMIRIGLDEMESIPEESIDYAVMEKSRNVKVVPADIGWNDVGSFDALDEEYPKDSDGNTATEKLIAINSRNNLIVGHERTIATIEVEDLYIVDTPDALLVGKKGTSQKIKEVVARLKKQESELPNIHLTVHRPWGTYTVLENSDRYKIKKIMVKPGKRLSLQKHYHRNEHWIVVSGTALVRVGDDERIVRANESTYIPMGELHRLENPGKIPLILIEAQVGEYTGEDDIVRIDDDFDRC